MDNRYTCHSGGCPGADMAWEEEGRKYGVYTIAYSFPNHKQFGEHQQILNSFELSEGFKHVLIANKFIKLQPQNQLPYIQNLLARNWFQVKNAEYVYAIGKFDNNGRVSGGTGWAVQMAIDTNKPVIFFNQPSNQWYGYDSDTQMFVKRGPLPILPYDFAGIGTRDLKENGLEAIRTVYRKAFRTTL